MTGAAYTFLGIVWVAILGTAGIALKKIVGNECNFSISVLQNYAPEMMDKDAIEKVIKETLAELSIEKPTPKDKGAIMKTLMPKVKGKADGKLVNEVLASMM